MTPTISFFVFLIINTLVLYVVSRNILVLDNAFLIKAFIVALIISLFNLLMPKLIGNPSGFHASMFAGIARVLMIIPPLILIKIAYSLTWKNFGYFAIAYYIIKTIAGWVITKMFY